MKKIQKKKSNRIPNLKNSRTEISSIMRISYESVETEIEALKNNHTEVDMKARKDAAKEIPASDQIFLSETELKIKSKSEACGNKILSILEPIVSKIDQAIRARKRLRQMFDEDPKAAVSQITIEENDRLDKEIQAIDDGLALEIEEIEDAKKFHKSEKEKDLTERNRTEDSLGYRPRRKPLIDYIIGYSIIACCVFTDFFVLFSNIEDLADISLMGSIVTALAVAFLLGYAGHSLGKFYRQKNRILYIASLITGIILILFVFLLRQYVKSPAMIALINIAVFLVVAIIGYLLEYNNAKLTKQYFADERSVSAHQAKIKNEKKKIISLEKKASKQKNEVLKKYEDLISEKIATYKSQVIDEYEQLLVEREEVLQYLKNCLKRVDSIYRQDIHYYRTLNQDERKDKGFAPVKIWEESNHVEPLDLPKVEEIGLSSNRPIDNVSSRISLGRINGMKALTLALFVLSGLFSACGSFDVPQTTECTVLIDKTDAHVFGPVATADFIIQEAGLDTSKVFRGEIRVTISSLNDRSLNAFKTIQLSKGESAFSQVTKERLKEQRQFYSQLINAFESTSAFSKELPISKLYLPICEFLNRLAVVEADKKLLVIFSDMMENTEALSLYKFRSNPEKLEKATDDVTAEFLGRCELDLPFPVELFIIHQPSAQMDDLHIFVRKFWKSFFTAHNCRVEFLAQI